MGLKRKVLSELARCWERLVSAQLCAELAQLHAYLTEGRP